MRDPDVRSALAQTVSAKFASQAHLLVPEVEIRWSTPARMDALLIADRLTGFEIKSDVDSLARLPRQVLAYGDVVERAHLVVGDRHRERAGALVPGWWGIWTAQWHGNDHRTVELRQVRRGKLNPAVNPLAVTSFLSRTDLMSALRDAGVRQLSSRSVDELRLLLVGSLGPRATVALARSAMLARADWRSKALATHT